MAKAKEDRRIRQEIVRVSRGVHGASTLKKKKKKRRGKKVRCCAGCRASCGQCRCLISLARLHSHCGIACVCCSATKERHPGLDSVVGWRPLLHDLAGR